MKNKPFLSICILSYNRPKHLEKLIKSIDLKKNLSYEIIVNDDFSPNRLSIKNTIQSIKDPKIKFFQHNKNLGYDSNLITLVNKASGKWIIFMGDDDEFISNSLNKLYSFLKANSNLGYVLKSHALIHESGDIEYYRYFNKTQYFSSGFDSYISLFRKSVFISGFTIRSDVAKKYITNKFKGTLLTQIYLLAESCLHYDSAYFDVPLTQQFINKDHDLDDVMLDKNNKLVKRKPTIDMSLDFLNSFKKITDFIDLKYNLKSSKIIKKDMSKYFYPSLSVHREEGFFHFIKYVYLLIKSGFGITIYFYIYLFGLALLNKKNCDKIIFNIKRYLKYTPKL